MAKNQLTKCKTCGTEIAKSAKACPNCGAKVKKKHTLLWIIIAILVVIVIIIAAAGKGSDQPKKVDETGTTQQQSTANSTSDTPKSSSEPAKAEKPSQTEFGVGDKAELNDIVVTLVDVKESSGSTFNTPTEGNVFVLCEFEIENNTSREITVSSLVSFDAYCDDYACSFSLTAMLEADKGQLDGTVAAGKKLNGQIGYEVPTDWKELEIRFKPDFWTGKEFIFVAGH